MTTSEFLAELEGRGIKLWAEGERLRYDAPADSLTAELRDELRARKADLIEYFEQVLRDQSSAPEAIPRRAGDDQALTLSFAQQRLWFLHELMPNSTHYNIVRAFRLLGLLDVAALESAIAELVRRHESLRTIFVMIDGIAVQRVNRSWQTTITREDLGSFDGDAVAKALQRVNDRYAEPFDLDKGPLLRAHLTRLGPEDHVFHVAMHHIVSDGWSMGVLYRELGALYRAFAANQPSPLLELEIQYADYALWQRAWLKGPVLERQLSYWRDQLANLPALELPTDRPRAAMQTYRGAHERCVLSKRLSDGLHALAQRESATLFMVLQSALAELLQRYSGQSDIVTGAPIANRNRAEIEGLIGFFVNSLVIRTDTSGNPSFRALLERVRNAALEAFDHQDLPFEKLVEELEPERDLSRNPFFQIVLTVQSTQLAPIDLGDLTLSMLELDPQTTRHDLEIHVWPTESGLDLRFVYDRDLFDRTTIQRISAHYQRLLDSAVADPDCPIADLEMLCESELGQILGPWSGATSGYPREATIPSLFEDVVRDRPEATAVLFGDRELSYRELNALANRLAHRLRRLGVGPESPVGLCLERGLDLVVAVLAIVKAGGAYVPLDPDYPRERLGYMLADSDAAVLLTCSELRHALPEFEGQVLCLDCDGPNIDRESGDNPSAAATASSLAYVVYTSGSTGRPKGTCIEHRSVVRLVKETNYVELGPREVILQFAPISFDASTFELWGCLLNGAKLAVMAPGRASLEELATTLRERRVTTLWLTAALFHQMVDNELDALRGVRQILAGGEALSVAHVKRMLGALPAGHCLINGYGPTENTTFTACHAMTSESEIGRSVPIGRPISNTWVYILDGERKPVPTGAAGELYIGGDGLARGYLNQPELTQERFVPDPFSEDRDARLYRTGDLVRYLADGTIEFLGRLDHQIKLRGYRIELGEIEAVLSEHPMVGETVVLLREDEPGIQRLVAYVVASAGNELTEAKLRNHLSAILPGYMVPSFFVLLDELPLTPVGKLDRAALPAVEGDRPGISTSFVAPISALEEQIAELWRDLLGIERIGTRDNFFDLGGHSLLATQIVNRVRNELGAELTLTEVFQHPTVSTLADLIENSRWALTSRSASTTGTAAQREGEL